MATNKRVMITGASGLLGRALMRAFKAAEGWQVLGLGFRRVSGDLKQLDLTDRQAVIKAVNDFKPTIIIHSAAERQPDVVEKEPEKTKSINVTATQTLCQAAAAINAWVLYISTDYVFDGKNPPYKVTDEPSPLNKYGISKLEGEKVTMQVNEENGILRIPILYSNDVQTLEESAVTVLFGKVKDTSKKCVMSDYERRFPSHCDDVAQTVLGLAEKRLEDTSIKGIYHCRGNENMTKYDMAVAMANAFNIPTDHIVADKNPSSGAPRPYNSCLDTSRIQELGLEYNRNFAASIKEALQAYA